MRHFRQLFSCIALCLATALLVISCNNAPPNTTTTAGTAGQTLNIYNWSTYIASEVLEAFQKQFNVKIKYDNPRFDNAIHSVLRLRTIHL
jgi:spermidine/putrescine-binding protein